MPVAGPAITLTCTPASATVTGIRLAGGASPRTIPTTRTLVEGAVAAPEPDLLSLHAHTASISAALQRRMPLSWTPISLAPPFDTRTKKAHDVPRNHYVVKLTAVVFAPLRTTPTRSRSAG